MMWTSASSLFDAALGYHKLGWSVFPVGPDKKPLTQWGQFQAVQTEERLLIQWWTEMPDANIGLACGPVSGVVVLDIDHEEGYHILREKGLALPETLMQRTGKGWHHFFADPGQTTKNFTKGKRNFPLPFIDFRGFGGYVVLTPSLHQNGRRYEWVNDLPLAPLPAWLLQIVRKNPKTTQRPNLVTAPSPNPTIVDHLMRTAITEASGGMRNDYGFWLACQLRDNRVSEADARWAMRRYVDAVRDIGDHTYEEGEAMESLDSAYREPAREPWASTRTVSGLSVRNQVDQGEKMVPQATSLDISKAVIEFPALLSLTIPERKCHVPWLAEGGIVMAYGPRGVGKTFFTLGLATALTAGVDFLQWAVTAPVGVLYVDGEMPLHELRTRATLLMGSHPKAPFNFLSGELMYNTLERDLVLTGEPMRDAVMTFLTAHPDIRVVILDNISCLFPGINEDKKQDWEPINAWLIRLRHRGLASALVHHAGKGGQQRGTSGREDALDTVIQIDRPAGYDPREGCHFEVRFTKSRSVKGNDVAPLDVKLTDVDGALQWTFKTLEESTLDQVRGLLTEGVTSVTDIAEELSISKGYASKLKRKAEAETRTE